jgi:hypothetical protein
MYRGSTRLLQGKVQLFSIQHEKNDEKIKQKNYSSRKIRSGFLLADLFDTLTPPPLPAPLFLGRNSPTLP